MADTTTTNLGLTKPEIGASADTWGNKLNTDLDLVDGVFAANGTGTSVGINVGAGKVAAVAGTLNVTGTVSGGIVAPLASPTFTGVVGLPSTTSIGPVSSAEIGYLDGVSSNVQTQLDAKLAISTAASTYAPLASPAFTGTPTAVTATTGTNTTQIATTAFVQQAAFNNTLPSQTGNAGKYVTTDGTNASWAAITFPAQVYPSAGVAISTGSAWAASVAPGTSGNVLTSNGTGWTSTALPVSAVSYPQNIQSGNYTLVLADAGKHIYSANTGAQTITIPTNASVAFPIGSVITIVNQGTAGILLSAAGVSVFPAGSATAVTSPVVPAGSTGQLVKVDTNSWEAIVGVVQSGLINYVVVGGGSGAVFPFNGGGGGGVVTGQANFDPGVLTVTVGAVGSVGVVGANSILSGSTTISARSADASRSNASIPSGLSSLYYDGSSYYESGGGGGGAGGAGGNGSGGITGGPGGIGLLSTITGAPVFYGAGGNGGTSVAGFNSGSPGSGSVVVISVPLSEYSGTRTGSPAIVRAGNNAVLTFTSSGTYTAAVGGGIFYSADMLVVAGGGGGGNPSHGGGGAGGYVAPATQTLFRGLTYVIGVGAGGTGASTSTNVGAPGGNSTVAALSLTALGGGGGGSQNNLNGQLGGSGGGGATNFSGATGFGGAASQPTSASGGFGNAGGNATGSTNTGAGGGGAGGAGASSAAGGAGGIGLASSITGTSVTRAVGGTRSSATAGPANTGNGGGGAAASGGSGVVIISIPTAFYTGTTTGSPVVTTSGSNTILQFNSSGSYTA